MRRTPVLEPAALRLADRSRSYRRLLEQTAIQAGETPMKEAIALSPPASKMLGMWAKTTQLHNAIKWPSCGGEGSLAVGSRRHGREMQ